MHKIPKKMSFIRDFEIKQQLDTSISHLITSQRTWSLYSQKDSVVIKLLNYF